VVPANDPARADLLRAEVPLADLVIDQVPANPEHGGGLLDCVCHPFVGGAGS